MSNPNSTSGTYPAAPESPAYLFRVQAMQAAWDEEDKTYRAKGLRPSSVNDTSKYTKEDWIILRESVAKAWATLELEANRTGSSVKKVMEVMAAVLRGYRHELQFIDSTAARVDELVREYLHAYPMWISSPN